MAFLTDKAMQSLPSQTDTWLIEDGARGAGRFMGRITPAGDRAFYYRYSNSSGKRDTLRIGGYDPKGVKGMKLTEARARAAELSKLYQGGTKNIRGHLERLESDQAEARKKAKEAEEAALQAAQNAAAAAITVNQLFERWASTELTPHTRADGTRSGRKDAGGLCRLQFKTHVFPHIGDINIQLVGKRELMTILDRVKAAGKLRTCNALLTNLKQMFQFALVRELIDRNPLDVVTKRQAGGLEVSRNRFLTEHEITLLTTLVPKAGLTKAAQHAIWLLLSTGARIGELMVAKWQDIDFEKCTWYIPETKNQRPHTVHLSQFAASHFLLLAQLRPKAVDGVPVPWVFPGKKLSKPLDIKTFGKQLADRQREPDQKLQRRSHAVSSLKLPGGKWTPHDLRRTAATTMARLGVSSDVIDECLNHMIASRVSRTYIRDRRIEDQAKAFDLLGAELTMLCATNRA